MTKQASTPTQDIQRQQRRNTDNASPSPLQTQYFKNFSFTPHCINPGAKAEDMCEEKTEREEQKKGGGGIYAKYTCDNYPPPTKRPELLLLSHHSLHRKKQ